MKLYTPNENFSLASGKYILYTTAVTLRHTASCPRTVCAVFGI